jgi:hypothetical protein
MSSSLTVYLNDHLAGSVAALELLDHLLTLYSGSEREALAQLRKNIEMDQEVLRQLIQALGGKESPMRKAAAWLTEKVGRAKLKFDDSGNGDLRILQALEALGLGIQGKLSLWRALAAVPDPMPQLRTLDLSRLQQRALDQFELVEGLRLRSARVALAR